MSIDDPQPGDVKYKIIFRMSPFIDYWTTEYLMAFSDEDAERQAFARWIFYAPTLMVFRMENED